MILTSILTCLLIICCSAAFIFFLDYKDRSYHDAAMEKLAEMTEYDKTAGVYLKETSYDGSQPVDKVLFTVPFQKTDSYIPNKDFVQQEEVRDIEKVAKEFMTVTFGTGYREMTENPAAYQESVEEFFEADADLTLDQGISATPAELAQELSEYYTKNHIQADVQFSTADCLVYQDIYTYVRGRLDISCYQNDNVGECEFLPEGIDLASDGSYIVEVALKKTDNTSGYAVAGYSVLKSIGQNPREPVSQNS
jgi:hypothetical protein